MPDSINDLMYEALDGGSDQLQDRARMLVGSARERFYENYATFDTTNVWEVVEGAAFITGPLGGAAAGSAPYLNINTGVGVNARTVMLSRSTFSGPLDLRYQVTASQRIVNNSFRIGFVEVDANGVLVTDTTRATAPTVLNARNASFSEQSGVTATTGSLLLRAAGSALQTVAAAYGAAFTTVATGTGPNFISATTYGLVQERDRVIARAIPKDSLAASGLQFANDTIIPNPSVRYRLCIIVENGAVAPASATDWRIHVINLLESTRVEISPRNGGLYDGNKAMPVAIMGGASSLGGALSHHIQVVGGSAHDAVISGNPVRVGARAMSAAYATVATGDQADLISTLQGVLVTRPWQIPELEWSYAAAAGGVVNTTDVVLAAAAGAGLRRYITSMTLSNNSATATEVVLKDGATIIWRGHLPANAPMSEVLFQNPLKTTANAALNFACITTAAAVYVNAQGFTAA